MKSLDIAQAEIVKILQKYNCTVYYEISFPKGKLVKVFKLVLGFFFKRGMKMIFVLKPQKKSI